MIKKIILFAIYLSAIEFFRLIFIPTQAIFMITFVSGALITTAVILSVIYDRSQKFPTNFTTEIGIILIASLLGVLGAWIWHGQSAGLTIWQERYMLFYFSYFLLHILKIKPRDMERIILLMAVIYAFSFLLQFAIYPRTIFNVKQMDSRGTIRIFLPGGSFAVLAYFMCLQYFFVTNKLKYFYLVLLFLATFILSGTRQLILPVLFVTGLMIVFSKRVKSRGMIILIIGLSIVPVFFLFQDIFMSLIEVSQEQGESEDEDIRVKAATFFLTEFFPNKWAYLTGNGHAHMAAKFGIEVNSYKLNYGYYQNDVGIIGDFAKFGVLMFIGIIAVFWKLFKIKIASSLKYARYFILVTLMGVLFGSPFTFPSSIIMMTTIFYLMDISNFELKLEGEEMNKNLIEENTLNRGTLGKPVYLKRKRN
jgi:hypothetical protein